MGLRTAAYFLERTEAVVARSALEDAGLLVFIGNEDWLRALPSYTLALGGYRLLVCEDDMEDALDILRAAQRGGPDTGEELVVTADILDCALSLFFGVFAGGAPVRVRSRRWGASADDASVRSP